MRKFLTLLTMALAISTSALAQHRAEDVTIQPRVGMTFSNLTDGDKVKPNLTYGVEFEYFMTDEFSLAGGVMFTNQGCKYDDIYNIDGTKNTYSINIYYGTLPVTANYYILPGLALKAGIQPALRVKANIEENNKKVDFDRFVDYLFPGNENKMNVFDLSIPVGLSYEYSRVTLDARYNIGLTNLITETSIHQKVFVVTLGYKF